MSAEQDTPFSRGLETEVARLTKERDDALATCAAFHERHACYEKMLREKWGTADAQRVYAEAFGAWTALLQCAPDAARRYAERARRLEAVAEAARAAVEHAMLSSRRALVVNEAHFMALGNALAGRTDTKEPKP